jgi:tetratricopeptide (TPR) repeat protein
MARRLDDPATLAQVLVLRSPTIWHASTLAERLALAEEQAALADELDDPTLALHAAVNGVHAAFEAGRFDLAESRLARAEALARELGQPTLRWVVMFLRARWAAVHGEFEEAEALATEALSLGEAAGQPDAFAAFAAQLFMIRTFQGRLGEIVDLVSQAATANPDLPGFQAALAHCYIELGRPDDARPAYERLAAADFAALPHNMTWIVGATVGAYVAARLGDGPRAVQLLGLLEPYRSQFASDRPTWGGSVAYYCGLLAACLEEWDAADDFLTEAAAAHERLGAVPLLALTRVDHASVLLARCGPGDDDRAHALLAEAEAAAAASGLEAVKRWSAALVEREAARTPATPGAGVEDGREEQP